MTRQSIAYATSNRGASAVEFAMVLPVLLLIIFGMIEYGWYFINRLSLSNAVATGARAAVLAKEWRGEPPEAFAMHSVKNAFSLYELDEKYITVNIKPSDAYGPRRVKVMVKEMPYNPLTGYLPRHLIPKYLSAQSIMIFP